MKKRNVYTAFYAVMFVLGIAIFVSTLYSQKVSRDFWKERERQKNAEREANWAKEDAEMEKFYSESPFKPDGMGKADSS